MQNKKILMNETLMNIKVMSQTNHSVTFELEGVQHTVEAVSEIRDNEIRVSLDSQAKKSYLVSYADHFYSINGHEALLKDHKPNRSKNNSHDSIGGAQMRSPMPGKILKIFVKDGAKVLKGDPVLVMEAMKMEHTIKASSDGVIEKILFNEGDQVQGGVELVKLC